MSLRILKINSHGNHEKNEKNTKKISDLLLPLAVGLACLVAVWVVGKAENPGPPGFRLDDAWIHMVYGKGLLNDGFLSYNDGVPSTGCTSPAWAVCLAVLHFLFGRHDSLDTLVYSVYGLGIILYFMTVVVSVTLSRKLTGNRFAGIVSGSLIALAIPLDTAAFAGMEIMLTCLLLLLAIQSTIKCRWIRAGIFWALACLSRPESAAVFAVIFLTVPILSGHFRDAAIKILSPSVVFGTALIAYHLWASGSPLPATFYAKSSLLVAEMPLRIEIAFSKMFSQIPPFLFGLGWIALVGYIPFKKNRVTINRLGIPLLCGITYLLANLLILRPVDPNAFYHLRYILPSVPLLLIAVTLGAFQLGQLLPKHVSQIPLTVLLMISLIGAAQKVGPESRHLHNDIRNINEVQRTIGNWLKENLPEGSQIAASDAGAIRYFSNLPTIDVMGLNTPQMLNPNEEFLDAHPVVAIGIMPAWFVPVGANLLTIKFRATTQNYTVTSNPRMATQVVAGIPDTPRNKPVRVQFIGIRSFALDFVPIPTK